MSTVVLTVVAAKVAGSETNFPVLITPSVIAGFGSISLADAQSSRIYADVTKLVEQAREVVAADEIHTKVAALTTLSECYFDYDGIRSDYSAGDTYGRNAVWSSYECVYHNNNTTDSAGNHTLTANGGVTLGGASGKIDVGTDFDGTNDSATHTGSSLGAKTAYSIQFWANPDSVTARAGMVMNTDGNSFATDSFGIEMRNATNGDLLLRNSTTSGAGGYSQLYAPTGTMVASVWQKITATRNAANAAIYKNGSSVATSSSFTTSATNNIAMFGFGAFGIGAFLYYNGKMDEVRIANFQIVANWETTEYNNQNDNAAFWTASGGGPTPTFISTQMMMGV